MFVLLDNVHIFEPMKEVEIIPSLIRDFNRVKQAIDYTGINNGSIHMSDIDAFLEFDDTHLILFEFKYKNNTLPYGQELGLTRIVNRWGKNGILFRVSHNVPANEPLISMVSCKITDYYHNGKWSVSKEQDVVKVLNTLGLHWNLKKLKF